MQVVILAGGKGNRLKPITDNIPKPMVTIHGEPFLKYQLELLKSFSLIEVVLLVSHLGNYIEDYFGNGSKFGMNLEYSYEKTLLGTGGALKNAEDRLRDGFLLLNGDTYLPINYEELIKYSRQHKKVGTLTVYTNKDGNLPNNIALGKTNLIIGYNKKDPSGMTHVDAGAMVFKKNVLKFIPKNKICSLEEEIFSKLIKKKELIAFPTYQKFYDIGSPEGLRVLEGALK